MPQTPEQRLANLAKGRETRAKNIAAKKAAGSPPIKKVKLVAPPLEDAKTEENAVLFDVEQAPDTVFPEESALDKVFKKLGLKGN
jgi:hypothetical protein